MGLMGPGEFFFLGIAVGMFVMFVLDRLVIRALVVRLVRDGWR